MMFLSVEEVHSGACSADNDEQTLIGRDTNTSKMYHITRDVPCLGV